MTAKAIMPAPTLFQTFLTVSGFHYEAAWSESRVYCRCFHQHPTLIDAAKCGMPQPGFYVLVLERGEGRELTTAEETSRIISDVRPRSINFLEVVWNHISETHQEDF